MSFHHETAKYWVAGYELPVMNPTCIENRLTFNRFEYLFYEEGWCLITLFNTVIPINL